MRCWQGEPTMYRLRGGLWCPLAALNAPCQEANVACTLRARTGSVGSAGAGPGACAHTCPHTSHPPCRAIPAVPRVLRVRGRSSFEMKCYFWQRGHCCACTQLMLFAPIRVPNTHTSKVPDKKKILFVFYELYS